jgi:hypothetical protein
MKTNRKKAFLRTLAALGLGALVLGSATTWAADMCILDHEGLGVMVGKGFSFPDAGRCKRFSGYLLGDSGCLITGTACGTSDNNEIRFDLTHTCSGTAFGTFGVAAYHIDRLNANLPLAGFGFYCQSHIGSDWSCVQNHIETISCPAPHPVQ